MADDVLANYIQQYIESTTADDVRFTWHGGEPTLAGLSFYQKVVRWQKMFADGKTIHNELQTNGLLLNDAWCEFLAQHNWLVGLSIDGDQTAHNAHRVFETGRATYAQVYESLRRLQSAKVPVNALMAVHRGNVHDPVQHYTHLLDLGFRHFQFSPLTQTDRSPEIQPWHISAKEYGNFLVHIFEHWQRHDVGRVSIQDFDSAYATLNGLPATLCSHSATCGNTFVVLKQGEVYSCDHYVSSDYFLGNITRSSLRDMQLSKQNVTFGLEKTLNLPDACQQCSFVSQCQGGCQRHRLAIDGRNILCAGYKVFFARFNAAFADREG